MKIAIFAGGCFWGVEHFFQKQAGVTEVISGYTGGKTENPSYQEICEQKTGHVEAVQISYDEKLTSYETLARLFFNIHDPTQKNGQGPDLGPQYLSVAYYGDAKEQQILKKLLQELKGKGYKNVQTKLVKRTIFYRAEDYHQNYYKRTGKQPYCHIYTERLPLQS